MPLHQGWSAVERRSDDKRDAYATAIGLFRLANSIIEDTLDRHSLRWTTQNVRTVLDEIGERELLDDGPLMYRDLAAGLRRAVAVAADLLEQGSASSRAQQRWQN